jgi:AraC-like DNA-binding protein
VDLLTDVLAVMRTGTPRSARIAWPAPWAQEFAPVPGGVGFHVILQGQCWLTRAGHEPVALGAGDVVFCPHGPAHVLADRPSTLPTGPACRPDRAPVPAATTPAAAAPAAAGPAAPGPAAPGPAAPGPAAPGPAMPAAVTLCGAYEVDPVLVHPLLLDLPEVIHLPARPGRNPELRAAVDLLAAELDRPPRLGTDALVPALLETLLLYILRTWLDEQPAGHRTGWPTALKDAATAAALTAIHRDPSRPWTVAALAAEARLSRAPFARRFTALVGQPPLTYLTWWRMTTAARLLRQDDAPLGVIAKAVGYTSEFAFAHAFKRRYGIAPGRYRRAV